MQDDNFEDGLLNWPHAVHPVDDTAALERELQHRITVALDLPAGSVGVIVGTGLILVKVAREDLNNVQRRIVVGVLIAMGLGGNLYHIL
jgi:hypothetical protein